MNLKVTFYFVLILVAACCSKLARIHWLKVGVIPNSQSQHIALESNVSSVTNTFCYIPLCLEY
jgi:hypothetical protein